MGTSNGECDEKISWSTLLLLTSVVWKPNLKMYWLTEQLLSTPVFSKIMKCDRFLLILKFLHFNNNDDLDFDLNEESRDWLHKIRPFLDLSCERFRKVYQLGKTLSVDESLVLFKGRLKFKQYIKTKRSFFGIKIYELATSHGITLDLWVYSGKRMFGEDDPNSDMPSTETIPSVLMEPFLGKGHVLYTDNFCTSQALASHFLKNKTHLCGTIWSNCRNYSKEITSVNLQKSQAMFYKPKNGSKMMACKYCANKDKASNKPKIVHMFSTCHQTNLVPSGKNDKDGNAVVWSLHSLENTIFTWAGWIISINSYIVWAPFGKRTNGTKN